MFHSSLIEISRSAYQKNIDFVHSLIGENTVLSAVIKGNAYGHGIEEIVEIAESCGVTHFSVFSADEAFRTFNAATKNPTIMIMGFMSEEAIFWAVENEIEFFVFDISRLEIAVKASQKSHKKARIHIELETGMNRTGFETKGLKKLVEFLLENGDFISIEGVCTHFAGAEEIANYVRIKKQIKQFEHLCKRLETAGIKAKKKHAACSAAVIAYPKTQMDMVRVGILQYGFWPSKEILVSYLLHQKDKTDPLRRLIDWKSTLMEIKHVKAGEFVGYGSSFLATENKLTGVIPVGYSNGYTRKLSNHGWVLIRGIRVHVIGVVNMNMLLVDLTSLPEVKVGDEVVLIGEQGDLSVSVASFSELSNQLNYEMLTRLPLNINREIID